MDETDAMTRKLAPALGAGQPGRRTLTDPAAVVEAKRRARCVMGWDVWLRKHRWDFFVRLSWGVAVGAERAERDVARWWAQVRRHFPRAAAVTAIEVSPAGRRHVHAMVYLTGEKYSLPTLAGQWHLGHLRAWRHGLTHVQPYRPYRHPGRGAAAYVVKGLTGVDVRGDRMPPAYRPRR